MARKVIVYTVEADNRDKGKQFEITEMPASQAEEWAMRAFLALAAAGFELDDEAARMGLAGLASQGIGALGKIPWELARPLMDEMFTCVKSKQTKITRTLMEEDIDEVSTRMALRKEVLSLHFDFFRNAAQSSSDMSQTKTVAEPGATTQTSLDLSLRPSRAG